MTNGCHSAFAKMVGDRTSQVVSASRPRWAQRLHRQFHTTETLILGRVFRNRFADLYCNSKYPEQCVLIIREEGLSALETNHQGDVIELLTVQFSSPERFNCKAASDASYVALGANQGCLIDPWEGGQRQAGSQTL